MKTAAVILICALAAVARADTLVLADGETLTGQIIAETPAEYRVRTANANFTITSVRIVPKTSVKTVQRDTPEQQARRAAFENLCRYQLNPNQEYTATYYRQVITLLEQHLAGGHDDAVRAKLDAWTAELAHVTKGLAKYNNRWMTPADKAAAVTLATQQARAAAARKNLDTQTRRLDDLQSRRENLARDIAVVTAQMEAAEAALAGLRDFSEPIYEFRPIGGSPYAISTPHGSFVWTQPFWERYIVGERVSRHPLRTNYEQQIIAHRARLDRLQASLEQTDNDIRALRTGLEKAQAEAKAATP